MKETEISSSLSTLKFQMGNLVERVNAIETSITELANEEISANETKAITEKGTKSERRR
ncbi:TPA_asm: hypothetical protein [Altiarchaeum virus]|nr:TPA_asm: hypothetical protein [Altiarchaeum virus]